MSAATSDSRCEWTDTKPKKCKVDQRQLAGGSAGEPAANIPQMVPGLTASENQHPRPVYLCHRSNAWAPQPVESRLTHKEKHSLCLCTGQANLLQGMLGLGAPPLQASHSIMELHQLCGSVQQRLRLHVLLLARLLLGLVGSGGLVGPQDAGCRAAGGRTGSLMQLLLGQQCSAEGASQLLQL